MLRWQRRIYSSPTIATSDVHCWAMDGEVGASSHALADSRRPEQVRPYRAKNRAKRGWNREEWVEQGGDGVGRRIDQAWEAACLAMAHTESLLPSQASSTFLGQSVFVPAIDPSPCWGLEISQGDPPAAKNPPWDTVEATLASQLGPLALQFSSVHRHVLHAGKSPRRCLEDGKGAFSFKEIS